MGWRGWVMICTFTKNHLSICFSFFPTLFTYRGVILWNSLPFNVRQAESRGQFKGFLKQVL